MDAAAAEAALIERARNGEKAAWVQIHERYSPAVFHYVRARVLDATVAEDVAAEVFVAAVRGIGRYRQQGKPLRAWLFGIAAHAVVDHQRRIGRRRRLHERLLPFGGWQRSGGDDAGAPPRPRPDMLAAAGEADAIVQRLDLAHAIERLTAAQREVMVLRYFVDMATAEIAAVMGKEPSAIYSLHARALIALRDQLGENDLPARDESRASRTISRVEAESA